VNELTKWASQVFEEQGEAPPERWRRNQIRGWVLSGEGSLRALKPLGEFLGMSSVYTQSGDLLAQGQEIACALLDAFKAAYQANPAAEPWGRVQMEIAYMLRCARESQTIDWNWDPNAAVKGRERVVAFVKPDIAERARAVAFACDLNLSRYVEVALAECVARFEAEHGALVASE
jgi:hypothetical protein